MEVIRTVQRSWGMWDLLVQNYDCLVILSCSISVTVIYLRRLLRNSCFPDGLHKCLYRIPFQSFPGKSCRGPLPPRYNNRYLVVSSKPPSGKLQLLITQPHPLHELTLYAGHSTACSCFYYVRKSIVNRTTYFWLKKVNI